MIRSPRTKDGARVGITDTTFRDAHQSLFATRMRTEHMLELAAYLDRVGFYSMEVWGGATFDTCLRYLGEDPWERLRLLRQVLVNTPMQMLLRGQNLVGYKPYADDVVDAFVDKMVELGIDIVRIFDALNDVRNIERAALAVKNAGAHFQGTISYTVSPVHTIDGYVKYARQLKDIGADSICVKDMAGILAPYPAEELVRRLVAEVGLPIQVHCHYTSGMASMSYIKSIEAGATVVDCSTSTVALGSSQPPSESLIVALAGSEYDTRLDVRQIRPASAILRNIIENTPEYSDLIAPVRVNTDVLVYQIPGGMISNLRAQLKQMNAENRIEEILAEVPKVRDEMGYPPLVTPMSQIVGTQATFNVIQGERYKTISNEVRAYIRGEYGRPPGEINPELKRNAIGDQTPTTRRPGDGLEPGMPAAREGVREFGGTEEDAISYALFPNEAKKYLASKTSRDL
ncbi:MAG: pyruvate carboxylase subunit B [Firmicutes bacterium]|jgi:oxaloacetate decarboxylase alpha subunit|nr:pyruvate carboxylase subunit B [Bacillota bacterium]NLH86712.1 pyruvate carboxylase subunit B [Bacillota bacterium]